MKIQKPYLNSPCYEVISNCKDFIISQVNASVWEGGGLSQGAFPSNNVYYGKVFLSPKLDYKKLYSRFGISTLLNTSCSDDIFFYPWYCSSVTSSPDGFCTDCYCNEFLATYNDYLTCVYDDAPESIPFLSIKTPNPTIVRQNIYVAKHLPYVTTSLNDFYNYAYYGQTAPIIYQFIDYVVPKYIHRGYPFHPADRMTTHWDHPLTKKLPSLNSVVDTAYVDLSIIVRKNGIYTTTFNGQPIPPSAFVPFPGTDDEYYVTQMVWYNCDTLPDYFSIDNPNGFAGNIYEYFFNNNGTFSNWYTTIEHVHNPVLGPLICSSPYDFLEAEYPHSNLSIADSVVITKCLGDTLELKV